MTVQIQLTYEEQEALQALVQHTGKSEDDLIHEAVGRYLRQTRPIAQLATVRRADRAHRS